MIPEELLDAARAVASSGAADAIEVVVDQNTETTLRFSNSVFHQGGTCSESETHVRVVKGARVGMASTNGTTKGALNRCLDDALNIARHVRKEPFTPVLPGPATYAPVESCFESTALMDASRMVETLYKGFKAAGSRSVLLSGALAGNAGEVAVLNSNGVNARHAYTTAHLTAVATKGEASGFKNAFTKDVSTLDVPALLEGAVDACLLGQGPSGGRAGTYRVLLEPPAVCELLYWLSYIGFGAKSFHEGTSFLSGRMGERVTGRGVTIYDDGLDEGGVTMPFDIEGSPRGRLMLIEKGVARGVAYDSFTAAAEGKQTTGNAPFPAEEEGPLPDHLFMEPGVMSPAEMLESLGNGLLIKSFHYVNGLLDPIEALMTGMTRHGTFLVEGGRIKKPLRPMRFTESVMKAFERIEGASKNVEVFPHHGFPLSSVTVPALLIDGFRFTG